MVNAALCTLADGKLCSYKTSGAYHDTGAHMYISSVSSNITRWISVKNTLQIPERFIPLLNINNSKQVCRSLRTREPHRSFVSFANLSPMPPYLFFFLYIIIKYLCSLSSTNFVSLSKKKIYESSKVCAIKLKGNNSHGKAAVVIRNRVILDL